MTCMSLFAFLPLSSSAHEKNLKRLQSQRKSCLKNDGDMQGCSLNTLCPTLALIQQQEYISEGRKNSTGRKDMYSRLCSCFPLASSMLKMRRFDSCCKENHLKTKNNYSTTVSPSSIVMKPSHFEQTQSPKSQAISIPYVFPLPPKVLIVLFLQQPLM